MISAQTVEMNYSFDTPSITMMEGYEQVQMRGCMQSALAGQPTLPWQSVSLLLPQGQEAESIEVELYDFQEIAGNHQLFPYQPSRTTDDYAPRVLVKDEQLYASKGVYPSENHGIVTTQYKNGFAFAFSAFTPVQYIPGTGQLMYAKSAKVRIHLKAAKADHSDMLWATPEVKHSIMQLAQNPEMMGSYNIQSREVNAYDLLIITDESFVDNYNEYREYYNSIGLRNRIVTTNEIYATMSGADNQEKIRNYIIQEYQNNGILMVVLGGDVNRVPFRPFYCYVTSGGGDQESNSIPADLYYSGLDGNWNTDGDNRFGEPGEDDLLPEVGVSRMSFNSASDLQNMIHKTLSYQQNPVLGEFHKVILAGEHLYDNPNSNGSDYLELLIGTHDDNGYTTTCYPTDYDFTKLYEEQGNWSGSLLKQAINAGTSYVHHDGHANSSYVAGWYGISNDDFSGANGTTHNYTFFHSQGCDCGAFDQNCILEDMIRIQNFAVAVIGNSRYGWFNEGQTEGPGCHLEREMTDAQWYDRIGLLSLAHAEGKAMTAPWVTAPGQWEEGALRWNFYDMNILGDGAVNVWLDEPYEAVVDCPSQVVVGSQSMTVNISDPNGNGLKNYRCLVYMDDEVIAMGSTDENGTAEIVFEGGLQSVGTMLMKVTGINTWPLTVELMSVPSNTPYVVYESYTLNGGEQIEFNGSYSFDMTVKNVGSVDATNVTATLSTESEYITIDEPTINVGAINGTQSVTLSDAFAFSVSDDVPNNTMVRFNLTCTDGTETWESHFNARVFAPEFELVGTTLETATGQALNPGDSGTVRFTFKNNGGVTIPTVTFDLFNSHDEITVTHSTPWTFNNVSPDSEFEVVVDFVLGDAAQIGALYELPYAVYYGHYILEDSYYLPIGNSMEGFETGDFSAFNWQSVSPIYAWEVVTQSPYEGSYCARSSNISHSETTALFINIDIEIESTISFFYKTSSEANWDKLFFKIDGVEKGNWSGEISWTNATFPLAPGSHQLRWEYSKDSSVSSGDDCVWIDNVVFPASAVITEVATETVNTSILYPNPGNGDFSLNLPVEECDITVFNSLGQIMHQCQGNGLTTVSLSGLSKGMYFVNIKSDSLNTTVKYIKE